MAKKRITLPSDINDIFASNDLQKFKEIFDKCDINAYERTSKETALSMYHIPLEFMRWLIENGVDLESKDIYGQSALWHQASCGALEKVALLLEHGADITTVNNRGNGVLHAAECHFDVVGLLLVQGADFRLKNDDGLTPMQYMLYRLNNIDISEGAKTAELYLNHGEEITKECQAYIQSIGENFEFHRERFNPEYLAETEQGLNKLYELFQVKPVAKRHIHDGVAMIEVKQGAWQEQFDDLYSYLVPSSGQAKTMQGELIRLSGRISDELMRNGGINWDREYKKMLKSSLDYFGQGENPFSPSQLSEVEDIIKTLYDGNDNKDMIDRLMELSVLWVTQNPNPVLLKEVNYRR